MSCLKPDYFKDWSGLLESFNEREKKVKYYQSLGYVINDCITVKETMDEFIERCEQAEKISPKANHIDIKKDMDYHLKGILAEVTVIHGHKFDRMDRKLDAIIQLLKDRNKNVSA
jgi:hypothetical protein